MEMKKILFIWMISIAFIFSWCHTLQAEKIYIKNSGNFDLKIGQKALVSYGGYMPTKEVQLISVKGDKAELFFGPYEDMVDSPLFSYEKTGGKLFSGRTELAKGWWVKFYEGLEIVGLFVLNEISDDFVNIGISYSFAPPASDEGKTPEKELPKIHVTFVEGEKLPPQPQKQSDQQENLDMEFYKK